MSLFLYEMGKKFLKTRPVFYIAWHYYPLTPASPQCWVLNKHHHVMLSIWVVCISLIALWVMCAHTHIWMCAPSERTLRTYAHADRVSRPACIRWHSEPLHSPPCVMRTMQPLCQRRCLAVARSDYQAGLLWVIQGCKTGLLSRWTFLDVDSVL